MGIGPDERGVYTQWTCIVKEAKNTWSYTRSKEWSISKESKRVQDDDQRRFALPARNVPACVCG